MLEKPITSEQAITAPGRFVGLDRARTCITLLVLLYHSAVNYSYFGNGDKARWLGFDLVALFNDSFFMACMFLIAGLFVCDSLRRRGALGYFGQRVWRLGVPFLVAIFVIMPVAYYPTFLRYHMPGTTDFSFIHFWERTITTGPWPSGPAWFLWVLLAFDAIAALIWSVGRGAIEKLGNAIDSLRERPGRAFVAFLIFSLIIYLPMHLYFGDGAWFEPGHYPLPIQTSRIFLYSGYFLVGVGIGAVDLRAGILAEKGALAARWMIWYAFALLFYAAILLLVYAHHNWIANFNAPPLSWRIGYGVAFALFSGAMAFTEIGFFVRTAKWPLRFFDAIQPSAYGIFLIHYIFIIWLQYAVYDPAWPPFVKFAIVFVGTLAGSWAAVVLLRKIPFVGRMI